MARIRERPKQEVTLAFNAPGSKREYAISEATTRDEALILVNNTAPTIDTVAGVSRFIEKIELKEFGGGCWDAIVTYVRMPNSTEFTFNIGAGSIKATTSLETIAAYSCIVDENNLDPPEPPGFNKGIGFNGSGFDGVDVEQGRTDFEISKKFQFSTLTAGYVQNLMDMAQTVNDDDFSLYWYIRRATILESFQEMTFPRGSLRFRGSRIKQDSDDHLDISFSFAYSRNTTAEDELTIGGSGAIEVEGHQYLWVYFKERLTDSALIKKPIAVYVERVYKYADFNDLELS